MKKMNKVIAAMMLMAITFATPAMADNKHHNNHDKKIEAVHHDKKAGHFDKHTAHFDRHHAPRPDMRICSVYLSTIPARVRSQFSTMPRSLHPAISGTQ